MASLRYFHPVSFSPCTWTTFQSSLVWQAWLLSRVACTSDCASSLTEPSNTIFAFLFWRRSFEEAYVCHPRLPFTALWKRQRWRLPAWNVFVPECVFPIGLLFYPVIVPLFVLCWSMFVKFTHSRPRPSYGYWTWSLKLVSVWSLVNFVCPMMAVCYAMLGSYHWIDFGLSWSLVPFQFTDRICFFCSVSAQCLCGNVPQGPLRQGQKYSPENFLQLSGQFLIWVC